MRHIILLGFGIVVALMVLVGALVMDQIQTAKQSTTRIVEVNNVKIELANTMRESIRLRQISMNSMLTMDDPFQLDEELIRFYNYAGPYREAREKLLSLQTNEEEKNIHARLTKQVRIAQPLNREAASLLSENQPISDTKAVVELAHIEQGKLLALLDELVELQHRYAKEAEARSQKDFEETLLLVISFGTILVFGTIGIAIMVARMVTRKNEELIQAAEETRSKSVFLANMSHEIRTPLTAIIGFAESVLHSDQSMEQRHKAITTIIRSGKHLLSVINDILDLSKIEANKLEIEKVSLSPFHLLTEIASIIKPSALEKGIVFGINYRFPLPEAIISDPLRVKQILLNLCSNALKFTDKGHIHINVSVNNQSNQMSFEVVDSGIGMNESQMNKIFEPFKQADSSTTRKYGGTGLGLSLSSQLALALDGSLTAKSTPGDGSQFTLTIATGPLNDIELVYSDHEIPTENLVTASILPVGKLYGTVLVAEDNPDNQELLSMLLRRLGIETALAENGRVAVDKASNNTFDLILMDMQMPEMDGLEAVRLLRQQGYNKPIVALTANAMLEDRERCLAAGCDDYLTKPIEHDRFYKVVSTYTNKNSSAHNISNPITSVLLEEEPDFLELIKKFIDSLPDTFNKIETAMQQEDWDNLKEILHQLKGLGGNFGYNIVSKTAANMEFQAINKNTVELKKLFNELKEIYNRMLIGISEDSAINSKETESGTH